MGFSIEAIILYFTGSISKHPEKLKKDGVWAQKRLRQPLIT
jgi:hypothetical protein